MILIKWNKLNLMSDFKGEVKFGVCMEDENNRELPNAVMFYRSIRQSVYAILYNLHHHTFMARKAKEEGQSKLSVFATPTKKKFL